jgi:PAS domain-containing protein
MLSDNAPSSSQTGLTSEQSQNALLNLLEDLQKDKEDTMLQRRAMLNIAEDALKAREELAKNNLELEVLGGLIQQLGQSLEMESVMKNIVTALRKFFPSTVIAYYTAQCGGASGGHTIYIDAPKKLNAQYLGAIEGNVLLGLETLSELVDFRRQLKLSDPTNLQFKLSVKSETETQEGMPSSMMNLPLVVPHVMGGIINLSSAEQQSFDQHSLQIIAMVIDGATATLQSLQSLIASERERFLDLLEKVGGAVLIFEASRCIRSVNPLMQTLLGKDRTVTRLEEVLEILQPRFKVQGAAQNQSMDLQPIIDKVLTEAQASYQAEVQLDNKYFQIFVIPMSDWQAKDMGGAIVLHDITTLKEIDRIKTDRRTHHFLCGYPTRRYAS